LGAAIESRRNRLGRRGLSAAHPLKGMGVMWAIRWEALWLWAMGEPLRRRPAPPPRLVTVGAHTDC
jgi:DUF1365 family protein